MGRSINDRGASLDHGYAWIVTAAVFGSNLLLVGYFRSFSVFVVDMVDTFNTTYTLASLIMSVQGAVGCLTALLVHNVLLPMLGVRPVAMVGGGIFSAGICLAYFAQSPLFLVFTLGVLVGVGNGAAYGPGTVLLGQYFEKRRALATSLGGMGGSVGSMALPLLTTELVLRFGLRGAFLLIGGLTLNLCVTSALYRPPPANPVSSVASSDCESTLVSDTTSSSPSSSSSSSAETPHTCEWDSCSDGCRPLSAMDLSSEREETAAALKSPLCQSAFSVHKETSASGLNSFMDKLPPCTVIRYEGNGFMLSRGAKLMDDCDTNTYSNGWLLPGLPGDKWKEHSSAHDLSGTYSHLTHDPCRPQGTPSDPAFPSLTKSLVELSPSWRLSQVLHTVESASMFSSQPHLPAVSPLLTEVERIVIAVESRPEEDDSDDVVKDEGRAGACQVLGTCVSCPGQLLRKPSFWLIQAHSAAGFIGSQAAFAYLPSMLQEKGMGREDVAVAVTMWGVCSVLGRLLCGVLADRHVLRPTSLTTLGFLLLAALFFLGPALLQGTVTCLAFMAAYGLLEGLYFSLLPILLIDLLTLQHFPSALGFTNLTHCTATTLIFPVLGQLRDQTGDFRATFCLIGTCALLSSTLFGVHSLYQTCRRGSAPHSSPGS